MRFLFLCISISLFADINVISLGRLGSVRYTSDNHHLLKIERLSPSDQVIYTHSYQYDETGKLISENLIGDLGEVFYDQEVVKSPFSLEICEYDECHNLIKYCLDDISKEYTYNGCNQMISENIEQCQYDSSGNVSNNSEDKYIYDKKNNLIQVVAPTYTINYAYDNYGNRISRTLNEKTEYYVYQGINEIAILDSNGEVEQLRIPGLSAHKDVFRAIAIETKNGIYAPIHSVQGNIIRLIDIATKKVINIDAFDPYGRGLPNNCPTPWVFSGKYYDVDANLVYFGSRYYSPELKRWITKDPLEQNLNLYQFCLDNPFAYIDPDGQWAINLVSVCWGAGWAITCPLWAPYTLAAIAGATVAYLGYDAYNDWVANSRDISFDPSKLGTDANQQPGEDFVWKGKGDPESGKGNWVNPKTGEKLHPDFNHAPPKGPH